MSRVGGAGNMERNLYGLSKHKHNGYHCPEAERPPLDGGVCHDTKATGCSVEPLQGARFLFCRGKEERWAGSGIDG